MRTSKREVRQRILPFVQWLYAHAGDNNVVGDLASSALLDPEISLEMTQKDFVVLVHARVSAGTAKREALKVLDEALMSYRSYANRVEQAINEQTEKTWLSDGSFDYNKKKDY